MTINQSIDSALAKNVGAQGIDDAALAAALARAEGALDRLRQHYSEGTLPLLRLPEKKDDLAQIKEAAGKLADGASDIVILGTGGSSLGGQTLAQLAGYAVPGVGVLRAPPRLHFIDNLDAHSYESMLGKLPLASTRFVAISKSGGTAETLMQTIAALSAVKHAGLDPRAGFLGISEPVKDGKRNGLRDLLSKHQVAFLDHDPQVGGRYSALTNVGLLPAAAIGLDIGAIRAGASAALSPVLNKAKPADVPAAVGAALAVSLAESKGKAISVLMAYTDRLERLTHWYVQLWAESLGKQGKGTTPLAALGPVDQHSQVQLFIGGPRDKLFNVVLVNGAGQGPRMDAELAKLAGEPGFAGKTIGDLVWAEGRATAETLAKNGCPVRTFTLAKLDEASLGELMMHFMLETIIAAHLMGIDAFDQPAVEEGKVLAKKYLMG
ncbi:glucose-6-phosphate isomerase [Pseudolabrys taiwanensis]|uniref:Glucose-6-phosphate isomerase n=1 Tax=Pseudolabrys taiwanensis TaxID=331696 RepID=A0A346A2U2_9HYPH|nr:glucose-6-phosphate isomerase [Pseudolabrys taiwanensis]AXK83489.1 glucose-6-phosphate isomerase [Pseudolabrys taiwanensis]